MTEGKDVNCMYLFIFNNEAKVEGYKKCMNGLRDESYDILAGQIINERKDDSISLAISDFLDDIRSY